MKLVRVINEFEVPLRELAVSVIISKNPWDSTMDRHLNRQSFFRRVKFDLFPYADSKISYISMTWPHERHVWQKSHKALEQNIRKILCSIPPKPPTYGRIPAYG